MLNKRFFIYIALILTFSVAAAAQAQELVVPAIKSPSSIKGVSWDASGKNFAYEVNGRIYIRDSLTLKLTDTYLKGERASPFGADAAPVTQDIAPGMQAYDRLPAAVRSAASSASGVTLSPDGETAVLYNSDGSLRFFNAKTGSQIGYVPNLGSKSVANVQLTNDSGKILITGSDNSLYVAQTKDLLFSNETAAPKVTQFQIQYNVIDPNNKDAVVTEYGVGSAENEDALPETEYITATKEKAKETQNFDVEKSGIVPSLDQSNIARQTDAPYFPPTPDEDDRNADFVDKDTGTVTEIPPLNEEYGYKATEKTTAQTESTVPATTPRVTQTEQATQSTKNTQPATTQTEKATRPAPDTQTAGTQTAPKEKKSLKETLKDIKEYKDPEIKEKYKDGQGILINIGTGLLPDPFVISLTLPTGYRNYKLIRPFYFGASVEPYLGFGEYEFPYSYTVNGYSLGEPKLLGARTYIPVGFCMFPFSNKFEVFGEIDLGASFNWVWNGRIGSTSILSSMFPAFYGAVKTGVAWDMFNISLGGSYDAIYGFSFCVELGVIIPIQRTRPATTTAAADTTTTTTIK